MNKQYPPHQTISMRRVKFYDLQPTNHRIDFFKAQANEKIQMWNSDI